MTAAFDALLVPVDDTPESERILPLAVAVAAAVDGAIELVTVDAEHGDAPTTALYQQRLAASLAEPVVRFGTVLRADAPVVDLLLEAYHDRPRSLLVLATRAPGSLWQWIGGSVGDDVVQRAIRPVLLAGPRCDAAVAAARLADRTTAALDGSALDDEVVAAALDWCTAVRTPLTILRAVVAPGRPDAHDDAVADLAARVDEARRCGIEVVTRVVDAGDPGRAVLHHVDEVGGTLVVGSHRRGPLGRIVHGSNALWLVHRATVPVLVAGLASDTRGTRAA